MFWCVSLGFFNSRRSTVFGLNGVVATSQPLACQVGLDILKDGGNAFDAAVGCAGALNVLEPTSTGVGGDVFGIFRTSNGEVWGLQSGGYAPNNTSIEKVKKSICETEDVDIDKVRMPDTGPHTVTVPGAVRGWEATLDRFGSKSLGEVLRPAIRYAQEGFPVSEVIADQWKQAKKLFTDKNAKKTYLVDGKAPSVGEVVSMPRLASTLRKIADRGSDIFYEGEIAEKIVKEIQEKGGFLDLDDLSSFSANFVEPVSVKYNGVEVFELPPNNQGFIALEGLNIAEKIGAGEYHIGSVDNIHYFFEALKLAFHDGHHYISDPRYIDVPELYSDSFTEKRARKITSNPNSDVSYGVWDNFGSDTVLVVVADKYGNIVSYMNSRFSGFGSGLVAKDTGIALQNRGSSFSLDSEHPNSLQPGKRPFHTLIPGLVRFSYDDWMAFGVMGGYMQPQGHIQVISNIVDHGMSIQQALDQPRWRYYKGDLSLEGQIDGKIATDLSKKGHNVSIQPPSMFGGGQIVRNNKGILSGASEPRKDGYPTAY